MSYADMVLAIVPEAPPTWKNRRATSCPAPISAKVPYFFASKLIWNAFLFVPTSISAFIRDQHETFFRLLNQSGPESFRDRKSWNGGLLEDGPPWPVRADSRHGCRTLERTGCRPSPKATARQGKPVCPNRRRRL